MKINNYYFFQFDSKQYCFNCLNYKYIALENIVYPVLKYYLEFGKYNYEMFKKDEISKTITFIRNNKEFFADALEFSKTDTEDTMIFSFCPAHICNLKCIYCFARQEKDSNYTGYIDQNTLKKIFEFILNKFPNYKRYKLEFVSGGEPLLHWEMVEYSINLAKYYFERHNKNFSILLVTNATQIDEEKINFLKDNNVDLCISIDGNRELQDFQRPMKNGESSYEAVVRSMNLIKKSSIANSYSKNIWAISVLTSRCQDIKSIIENNIELGFASMELRIARGKNSENFLNMSNLKNFEKLYTMLYNYFCSCWENKEYQKILFCLNEYDYFGKILYRLLCESHVKYRCQAAKNKLAFTANGDIYPCDSFVGNNEYYMGNVFDGNVDEKIVTKFLKNDVDSLEKCSLCKFKYLCSGSCYYDSEVNVRDIKKVCESYCELMNIICKLAIKLYIKMQESDPASFIALKNIAKKRSFIK